MARYVLRYQGIGPIPAGDVARVRNSPGVAVLDETPRMLLVEATEETATGLAGKLPQWVVAAESEYKRPNPRRRAREEPGS